MTFLLHFTDGADLEYLSVAQADTFDEVDPADHVIGAATFQGYEVSLLPLPVGTFRRVGL